MKEEILLPRPKKIKLKRKFLLLGSFSIEGKGISHNKIKDIRYFLSKISPFGKKSPIIPIKISIERGKRGYFIKITEKEISIQSEGIELLYPALSTLIQVLKEKKGKKFLPIGEIEDWPDYQQRGLYIESYWGTDLMKMKDWQELIDLCSQLKFNLITIGVYNCWAIRWGRKLEEFYFIPSSSYPKLSTPMEIRYYSAQKDRWINRKYIPIIFKNNLFGRIVEYGRKMGIMVRPHFNSLGHNTLIPRLIPEISAKKRDGTPTGYGFCLSNPVTYKVLFNIFDEICERYLFPNKVFTFHIGLDEVYPVRNLDLDNPYNRIDPWCKCKKCQKLNRKELFLKHLFALAKHLKKKGVKTISVWHDQLKRMNLINEKFIHLLKSEGLKDVLNIEYWYYGKKVTEDKIGNFPMLRWSVPLNGYTFWLHYPDHTKNIHKMLLLGKRKEVIATEAYGIYSPSFHRNYLCLSEFAWNASGSLKIFKDRYLKYTFGDNWVKAKKHLQTLLDMEKNGLGDLFYRYTEDYPTDVLNCLWKEKNKKTKDFKNYAEQCSKAKEYFKNLEDKENKNNYLKRVFSAYYIEAYRGEVIYTIFSWLLSNLERNETGYFLPKSRMKRLNKIKRQFHIMLSDIERIWPAYLVPHTLRVLSYLEEFLQNL